MLEKFKIDFDSLKKNHWNEQEQQNVNTISDFVQNLMNNHDFDYILEKHGGSNYLQHNMGIPDGIT